MVNIILKRNELMLYYEYTSITIFRNAGCVIYKTTTNVLPQFLHNTIALL